jgi:hypothetical protein
MNKTRDNKTEISQVKALFLLLDHNTYNEFIPAILFRILGGVFFITLVVIIRISYTNLAILSTPNGIIHARSKTP